MTRRLVGPTLIAGLAALVGIGLWQTHAGGPEALTAVVREPQAVMGTTCELAATVPQDDAAAGEQALRKAEAALRDVEARMSVWLAESEVSRLNAAPAGVPVPLSGPTLETLRAARAALDQTGGAFDVTCRPLIELWRQAGARNRAPDDAQLAAARAASHWDLIDLSETAAVKRRATACVDLGGIAKGYGIDRALEAIRRQGAAGGLVDVGGDLRCFGRPPEGEGWTVEIRNPFGSGTLARLALREGAVCTSGNYARFVIIEGRRYSHIVDPRTGFPADRVPSATVVASTAMQADIWATALSVLGEDGFARLPEGVEALIVTGERDDHRVVCTRGFARLLAEPLAGLEVR